MSKITGRISREWFIEFKNENANEGQCTAYVEKVDGLSDKAFHVIEHSEYRRLLGGLEEIQSHLADGNHGLASETLNALLN